MYDEVKINLKNIAAKEAGTKIYTSFETRLTYDQVKENLKNIAAEEAGTKIYTSSKRD